MRRRAIILLDAVIGIGIVAVLLVVLGISMTRQQQAAEHLANHRKAIRSAEAALTALQNSAELPKDQAAIQVNRLSLPNAQIPAGHRWVKVESSVGKQHAELIGLVPATRPSGSAAEGGPQ